jgi:hypothetical protein
MINIRQKIGFATDSQSNLASTLTQSSQFVNFFVEIGSHRAACESSATSGLRRLILSDRALLGASIPVR